MRHPIHTVELSSCRDQTVGSAAVRCSNQTDPHLTFTDPIWPSDLPQRPSPAFLPLATDLMVSASVAELRRTGSSGCAARRRARRQRQAQPWEAAGHLRTAAVVWRWSARLVGLLAFIAGPDPGEPARPLGGAAVDGGLDQREGRAVQRRGQQDFPQPRRSSVGLGAPFRLMRVQILLKISPASNPLTMPAIWSTGL